MAETIGLVLGIALPALHGIQRLITDIRKIVDAPQVIQKLEGELKPLNDMLYMLTDLKEEAEYQALGKKVTDHTQATIETCLEVTKSLQTRIDNWTRSKDGRLSWRQKVDIGFFREHRLQADMENLKSCKASLQLIISSANLFILLQAGRDNDETKEQLEAQRKLLKISEGLTNQGIGRVVQGQSHVRGLRPLWGRVNLSEAERDDVEDDERALERTRNTFDSANVLIKDLRERTDTIHLEWSLLLVQKQQANSTSVSIGDNTTNNGLLLGNNTGQISGNFHMGTGNSNP